MESNRVAVALVLSREVWEKVKREARRRRVSVSLLLEEIIEEWFESEEASGVMDDEFYSLLNQLDERINKLIDRPKDDSSIT